jgi:hypothetical protein
VALRSTSTVLFDPFWPPCASQIHAQSVALVPLFGQSLRELRRCRNELHTSRDRKRNVRIFEPPRGFNTPLSMPLKNLLFLCRSRP